MPASGNFAQAKLNQDDYRKYAQTQYFEKLNTNNNQQGLIINPTVWEEIGPFNNSQILGNYSGTWSNPHLNNNGSLRFDGHVAKIDRLFAHPNNQQIIYALGGGLSHGGGGLYKSTDGGFNWVILGTDVIPHADVMTFAIKPTGELPDATTEYLFIGLSTGATYRSDDDGATWYECGYNGTVPYPYVFNSNPTNSLPYSYDHYNRTGYWAEANSKFQFTKKDASSGDFSRLVVARAGGIYYSDNYNASITPDFTNYELTNNIIWNQFNLSTFEASISTVAPNMVSRQFVYTDFEYYIIGGVTTYVASLQVRELDNNGDILGYVKHYVCTSTDFGNTWSFYGGTGNPNEPHGSDVSDKSFTSCNIEVRRNNPEFLHVATTARGPSTQTAASYHLKRFRTGLGTWTNLSVTNNTFDNNGMATQANGFAIDPNNESNWWFYTNAADRYVSGTLLDYTGAYGAEFHADVRDILVLDNGTILAATDGGVYQSTDNGQSFDVTSEGMGGAESDRMAVAQQPPFYVASGFWHCGLQVYNPEEDIWHWRRGGDGKLGGIFFLNKERFSFSNQTASTRVHFDFNDLNTTVYTGGQAVGSENIPGRNYVIRRSGGQDNLTYNNDDLATTTYNTTGFSFGQYTAHPIVIPNEADKVCVLELDGNTQKIKFYTGASQSTPTLTYDSEIDLYAINGNSACSFNGICFDTRRNGVHWIVLNGYPTWGGNGVNRIVEYNPSTSSYDDITFVTDDNINGQSASFPDFLHINGVEVDRQTGILYIGTTNGVYYLDRANETWRKYSLNVPLQSTQLGIVHCTGELYASAKTRGIWKTDLIRNANAPTMNWEISTSETWNDRTNLFCTLTIKTGATLYVNEDIVVYGDQKIIVEPGARIVIQNNAKITTECGDFWSGIEVWGDNTAVQNAQNQGMVTMLSGGSIQNAKNAIRVWKPGDWSSMGGIVQATNASFVNNKRDVEFMPYSGINVGSSQGNLSYFQDCDFKTDNAYMGTTVAPHVSMYKVDGVRFTTCHFSDEREVNISLKNKGIHSLDSKFKVLGKLIASPSSPVEYYNTTYYDPSTFTNLTYGVWAGNATTQNAIMVDQSLFTDCQYGVTLSESNDGVVTRNKFDRTEESTWFGYQYDIYTNRASGYTIEGNEVTKQGGDPVIGITNQNSGVEDNEVYRNKLFVVEHGVYGYGLNKNSLNIPDAQGLEYLCNTFDENGTQDELFVEVNTSDGIKIRQGVTDEPAGNKFTNDQSGINYHLNSGLTSITEYIYFSGSAPEEPTLLNGYVNNIPTNDENVCKTNFDVIKPRFGSILEEVTVSSLTTQYENDKDDLDDALYDLSKATDSIVIDSLENRVLFLNRELSRTSNIILKDALLDSTIVDSTQYVTWILERNDEYKFQKLVDFYWSRGDSLKVEQYLDSVETAAANYPRGSREEAEFLDYEDFKSTLHGYADANGNLQGLDSLTEVSARDAALRKRGHAQVQGQNLLCFFLGECNDAPEPPASGERMMNDESFEEEIFEMSESDRLEIFPNPSSTEITVSLDTDYLPVVIRIIDAEGKQVLKQQSMNEEQSLDISRLETGVYFVLVTDQQGLSYMKKLVKN